MDITTKNIAPGVDMPVINIGCDFINRKNVKKSVKDWLQLGGRGIDTSLKDGNQAAVEKGIMESGVSREDIFITTKVINCNPDIIASRLNRDLELLNTSYVDLLLIHHPTGKYCKKAWAEMEKAFKSNQTRAIGVSNFGKDKMMDVVEAASILPHLIQMKLNLFEDHSEEVSYLNKKGIAIQSSAALGYGHDEPEELAILNDNPLIQTIAVKYKINPYQVAMKWILQHDWLMTFPLIEDKVEADAVDLSKFELSRDEMDLLDNLKNTLETDNGEKVGLEIGTETIAPDVDMPVISIGCDGLENHQVKDSVIHWLELGGRGIDTSLHDGSQRAVARAIDHLKAEVDRKDIFITTKIPNCNAAKVAENVAKDLALLNTSYVDLLLIHHGRMNCTDAWAEMEKVYNSKQARAIGLSHFNKMQVTNLLENATIVPHVAQMDLNVLETKHGVMKWFNDHNITVQSTAPLGRDMSQDLSVIADNPTIDSIAKAYEVTPYQIAIKWILQHGWLLTFEATRDVVEAQNANVMNFELTKKEMHQLDGVSRLQYYSTPGKKGHASGKSNGAIVTGVGGVGAFIIIALACFVMKRIKGSRMNRKSIELANTDGVYRDHPADEIDAFEDEDKDDGKEEKRLV